MFYGQSEPVVGELPTRLDIQQSPVDTVAKIFERGIRIAEPPILFFCPPRSTDLNKKIVAPLDPALLPRRLLGARRRFVSDDVWGFKEDTGQINPTFTGVPHTGTNKSWGDGTARGVSVPVAS